MTLEQLKDKIINKEYNGEILILKCDSDRFIAQQYYHQIAKDKNLKIELVDDLNQLQSEISDVWGTNSHSNSLLIYIVDEFETDLENIDTIKNLIIVCNKIEASTKNRYGSYVTTINKLESEQIRDYVYSIMDGMDHKKLDWIIDICQGDIYRIQNELDKLLIMESNIRNIMFDEYVADGVYNDLSNQSVFNLTNALIKKDYSGVVKAYKDMQNYEITEMGFFALLYNGFRHVIDIQLGKNPTAEKCGLKPNQFNAIKYNNVGKYSREQLIDIYKSLTDMDRKIKTGEFDIGLMFDYLIVDIFNK